MQQRRRRLAFVASLVVAAVVGVPSAPPAAATAGFDLTRIASFDRFATAALLATSTFGQADVAIVASGRDFPDALAGNYLAGKLNAPILLAERDSVPATTLIALDQLGVERVVLLGGEAALSLTVDVALSAGGYVVSRVAGPDRFATAAAVVAAGGAPTSPWALLASGRSFADALSGGPIAYGAGAPQLLTEPQSLPAATAAALTALNGLGTDTVFVLGGTGVISDAVVNQVQALGLAVVRVAGGDRYATSAAIADLAVQTFAFAVDHIDFATGTNFPDALAGGPHSGSGDHAVLLVEPGAGAAEGPAADYLRFRFASVTGGHVFGGPGALDDAAVAALVDAGRGVESPIVSCEQVLAASANDARRVADGGLAELQVSGAARSIARTWAQHLAATGGLAHNPQLPTQLTAAGINWTAYAENVAFGPSAAAVHALFMGSDIHRGNILSPAVNRIATGCARDGAGQFWVTEVFFGV